MSISCELPLLGIRSPQSIGISIPFSSAWKVLDIMSGAGRFCLSTVEWRVENGSRSLLQITASNFIWTVSAARGSATVLTICQLCPKWIALLVLSRLAAVALVFAKSRGVQTNRRYQVPFFQDRRFWIVWTAWKSRYSTWEYPQTVSHFTQLATHWFSSVFCLG